METLKSCNYCKKRDENCSSKMGIENKLTMELEFIDRLKLLSSTKFWQAIAENCEAYVLQKGLIKCMNLKIYY